MCLLMTTIVYEQNIFVSTRIYFINSLFFNSLLRIVLVGVPEKPIGTTIRRTKVTKCVTLKDHPGKVLGLFQY